MVARADVERFRRANADLSALVREQLGQFFRSLNLSKPEAVRDALLEFLPLLTDEFGTVAAALAAEWYEELRADSGAKGRFRTLTAETVPAEAVQAKVRYHAGHLWTPEPETTLGGLLVAADKYVKQPGRATIERNAQREGVRWARVPAGSKTCSFCLILASRDAVYASEKSAGSKKYGRSNQFHGDCDCSVIPVRSPDDYPSEYLPDDYMSMYKTAASDDSPEVRAFLESLPRDDKNKQIKAAAFSLRRNFPSAVKDSVKHPH